MTRDEKSTLIDRVIYALTTRLVKKKNLAEQYERRSQHVRAIMIRVSKSHLKNIRYADINTTIL